MVSLKRPTKPGELSPEKEQELVKKYMETGASVWDKKYIRDALCEMSHAKCSYCETKLGGQGKPMHVDHYLPKKIYPGKVMDWGNLLPACSQCNSNKGVHDTGKEPIINPAEEDPRNYFYLDFFLFHSKDKNPESKGQRTIDLLDLNNQERLALPRVAVCAKLMQGLTDTYRDICQAGSQLSQLQKTRFKNKLKDILKAAQPDAEYSAFVSTVIMGARDYQDIKGKLLELSLWDEELSSLEEGAMGITYEIKAGAFLDNSSEG